MTILVTGGAGFIGSNFVIDWFSQYDEPIVNLDKLTYAGNRGNLSALKMDNRHIFVQGDIGDKQHMSMLLQRYQPRAVINFAAESHVDRSIQGPEKFIETNITGTFCLLEAARIYWRDLPHSEKESFRFLHISTDEVYGSLAPDAPAFSETNRYAPNSPYSASKASSDHLVRAYHCTYGLPVLITNCSNNYGPYQFPEKLIPLIIQNALFEKPLPIYGDGLQMRDWVYVSDHCHAIRCVLDAGTPGETYNIGGVTEKANIEIAHRVCDILNERRPLGANAALSNYRDLITYVEDRPGHDRRYAIDATKIREALGWAPVETFETGIRKTVDWYLNHQEWIEQVTRCEHPSQPERQYA